MNKIEQIRMEKFASSNRVDEIMAVVSNIEDAQLKLIKVTNKLGSLINGLEADKAILNSYMNEGNVNGIENTASTMEAKTEALAEKDFIGAINALAKVFGIEDVAKVDTKKLAREALGFKSK